MKFVTFPKGRILWHARWQPKSGGGYRNVMESPDYLYTSPQIQQALYHGLATYTGGTLIQLTKLRVKKPLSLVVLETKQDQLNMANAAHIKNFKLFSNSDIRLLKEICKVTDPEAAVDGWRAVWDQDQIALCAKVIKDKLEVIGGRYFDPERIEFPEVNVEFFAKGGRGYYRSIVGGRQLVAGFKMSEKAKAAERKVERTAQYLRAGPSMRIIKKIAKKRAAVVPPAPGGFKRPVKRRKV